LNTLTNPTPALSGDFASSIAAVGNDRVLVGASFGNPVSAYLFSTNGTLLTPFTNPAPVGGSSFAIVVAAVGGDRVVIRGPIGANRTAAYLYSTDGTLLTTFTNNPTPTTGNGFGRALAAVGSSRILIGAPADDTGAPSAGVAYLFSTNGTLLNTITNPTPETFDYFGWAVAAVGKDQVLIGALHDNTGAQYAGSAYLFDLPYPPLSIARNAAAVSVKWLTPETGLALQQAGALGSPTVWSNPNDSVSINGLTNVVQQTMTTTNRFFRLRRP
jgi:hypothetical protein